MKHECLKLHKTQCMPYQQWQIKNWRLMSSAYPNVAVDMLREYIYDVMLSTGNLWQQSGFTNIDYSSKHINVFGGIRHTLPPCDSIENDDMAPKIYMFGDSRMYGVGVEDKETLPSCLQHIFNMNNIHVKVINYGVRSDCLLNMLVTIKSLTVRNIDKIVLFLPQYSHYNVTSNSMSRFYYWQVLREIIRYAESNGTAIYLFKYPDIRMLKHASSLERMLQTMLNKKKYVALRNAHDSVLTHTHTHTDYVPYYNTQKSLDSVSRKHSCFWDFYHFGPIGNKAIADFIHPILMDKNYKISADKNIAGKNEYVDSMIESFITYCSIKFLEQDSGKLEQMINKYKKYPKFIAAQQETIGAVVMNCNPFTNGHAFLVERALSEVDYLYIFIVNEDKSLFSFEHRFYMVQNYFADNKRIMVLPGGDLMITSLTFNDYFNKDRKDERIVNVTIDIDFFGKIIARQFNITKRFVGAEPYCPTTALYNQSMKRLLPKFGVEYIEIPRKNDGSNLPVSASRVRQYMQENNWDAVRDLVPPVTLNIIQSYYVP